VRASPFCSLTAKLKYLPYGVDAITTSAD
jgi:hypothetical protein